MPILAVLTNAHVTCYQGGFEAAEAKVALALVGFKQGADPRQVHVNAQDWWHARARVCVCVCVCMCIRSQCTR